MAKEIIHEHVLGSFIFREDGTLIADGPFAEMKAKHQSAVPPTEMDIMKICKVYRQENLRNKLISANRSLTKRQISTWVSEDQFIIQCINNIEELQKAANLHSKRLKEWYGLFAPEVVRALPDHETFARAIVSKSPEALLEEMKITLTMGNPSLKDDCSAAIELANLIIANYDLIKTQMEYLEKVMKQYCPNMLAVAGATIGAKLLAEVMSLKRLSQLPSSTVQLLGAEKALFRHLRNKQSRPPKHGYIISHSLIMKAPRKDRGKVARALADKISIAAKVDYFKGEFIGEQLRKDLEAKFA